MGSPEGTGRIDDAKPKVIVSASCGIEGKKVIPYIPLLTIAIDIAEHKPEKRIILQRPQLTAELGPDDVDWATAVATSPSNFTCLTVVEVAVRRRSTEWAAPRAATAA